MFQRRLKELRKSRGISQQKMAEQLYISQQAYAKYETGASSPNPETLSTIAKLLNVTVDDLLGSNDSVIQTLSTPSKGVWVPVLGKVQAGIPVAAVQDVLDHEEITKEMASQGEFFALQVKGGSMEPRIKEGDVVIVRKQSDADTGDIAVVLVNGDDATVKRIKKRPEGIMLIPNNPAYEPMFYSSEEEEKLPVVIVGKVVELRAKL